MYSFFFGKGGGGCASPTPPPQNSPLESYFSCPLPHCFVCLMSIMHFLVEEQHRTHASNSYKHLSGLSSIQFAFTLRYSWKFSLWIFADFRSAYRHLTSYCHCAHRPDLHSDNALVNQWCDLSHSCAHCELRWEIELKIAVGNSRGWSWGLAYVFPFPACSALSLTIITNTC